LLACLFAAAFAGHLKRRAEAVVIVDNLPGDQTVTALSVEASPSISFPDAILVKAAALTVDQVATSSFAASAEGFAFGTETPDYNSGSSVAYYFAYASASGTASLATGQTHIQAAFVELIAAFFGVFAWVEVDGTDGFSWDGTTDFLDPNSGGDYIVEYLGMETLSWNYIDIVEDDCSTLPGAVGTCSVYTFTSSTTDTSNGGPVVQFDMRIASQPVLVGANDITPDVTKVDVSINYPWGAACSAVDCQLGIWAAAAGLAASGSIDSSFSGATGSGAVEFQGDTAGYFSWVADATVASGTSTIVTNSVSSDDILAITPNILTAYGILIASLQFYIGVWNAFSWQVNFYFFSTTDIEPASFVWDPKLGLSSASSLCMSMLLALLF